MAQLQTRKKRQRYVMTLEQKINVLDRLARGEGPTSIGLLFNVNESTIRTIKRNEESIRASVLYSSSTSVKVACVPRDHNIEKTEKVLHLWIAEQLKKNTSFTSLMIREKAKRLYNYFVQNSDAMHHTNKIRKKEFNASKGWFEKFKKRYTLQNMKLAVENEPDTVIERLEAFDDMEYKNIEDILQTHEFEEEYKIDIVEEKPCVSEELIEQTPPEIKVEPSENEATEEIFENVNIKQETFSDNETEMGNKNNIDLRNLNQGIIMAYHLADHFTEIDPDSERSAIFRSNLEKLLEPYQELQQQTINRLHEN